MVDVFIALLEDAEHELGLGEATTSLKNLGDQLKQRMYQLAEALPKLEKKGWNWTTGSKDIYLHNHKLTEAQAKRDLKEAGIPETLVHFVH
ncbi:hypothetical protein HY493_02035 [Candidatus Woesearchaeota archaeon]|nr:hypothetical protein [Candidatus Woesearchaeota archaeon]